MSTHGGSDSVLPDGRTQRVQGKKVDRDYFSLDAVGVAAGSSRVGRVAPRWVPEDHWRDTVLCSQFTSKNDKGPNLLNELPLIK